MIEFLFLTLLALFFLACEKPTPIDKGFALAYAELRIAEREYGETEDGMAIRFQILQKHGLDVALFEEKIENIKKEGENWLKFQKTVVDILDSLNKRDTQ
ncbi:MAG: hypothetical protein LBC85_11595 [Fibromonadaceae bacterium]|jgi:hypothetical protein|nr:hypothetical protein [Fibromonadaceae bacterium]